MSRTKSWVRLYTNTPLDLRVRRLKISHRWVWISILCLAGELRSSGKLLLAPEVPACAEDIADFSGVPVEEVKEAIEELKKLSLLREENGVYIVADWDNIQAKSDSSAERVRRYRERRNSNVTKNNISNANVNVTSNVTSNGVSNVTVTLQESLQETLLVTAKETDDGLKEKEKEKEYPPLIEEVENTYIGEEEPSEKQENISLAVKEKEKEKESSPITPKEKEKEKENILSPQEKEKEREIKDISYEISLACESQANYTESEILDEILKTSDGDDSKPTKKLFPNKKILPPEPDIRVPYKKIMTLFNEICGATFHKVEFLSPQRRYTLQKLYKNFGGLERFRTLFEKAKASPFLRGENKSGWRANFDWILEHAYDILEGKYDEAKPEGYLPEMESIPILDLKRYVSDEYLQLWRELVKAEQGFETGEIFEFDQSVIEEYKQDIELFKTKHKLEKVADFPKRREAYLYVYEKRKNEEKYVVGR